MARFFLRVFPLGRSVPAVTATELLPEGSIGARFLDAWRRQPYPGGVKPDDIGVSDEPLRVRLARGTWAGSSPGRLDPITIEQVMATMKMATMKRRALWEEEPLREPDPFFEPPKPRNYTMVHMQPFAEVSTVSRQAILHMARTGSRQAAHTWLMRQVENMTRRVIRHMLTEGFRPEPLRTEFALEVRDTPDRNAFALTLSARGVAAYRFHGEPWDLDDQDMMSWIDLQVCKPMLERFARHQIATICDALPTG